MDQTPDHYVLDDGSQRWELDHKLHRDDGPALITPEGHQSWYRHGLLHRDGGPAVIMAHGTRKWFRNNKRHREDGPAVETGDPAKDKWYIDDRLLSPEEVEARIHKLADEKRRLQGEEAASAIKDGLPHPITPMKPIKFN